MQRKSDRPEHMQKLMKKQLKRIERKDIERIKKLKEHENYLDSIERGISAQ